jgi:hypothetical protein
VHFFAGLDKTFAGYATVLFNELRSSDELPKRELMGSISFPLSKATPPLQVADMLVNRLYQHNMARFCKDVTMSPILKRLLKNKRPSQEFFLFTKDTLAEFIRDWRSRTGAVGDSFQGQ